MRVAIPVDDMDFISKSAEEAKGLIFFDVEEDEILSQEKSVVTPLSLIPLLRAKEVDVFICSNLDIPLMVELSGMQCEIVGGAKGKAKSTLLSWINGTMESSDIICKGSIGGCSGDCSHCH